MNIDDYEFDFASAKTEVWGDLAHAVQQLYGLVQGLQARIEQLEGQLAEAKKPANKARDQ